MQARARPWTADLRDVGETHCERANMRSGIPLSHLAGNPPRPAGAGKAMTGPGPPRGARRPRWIVRHVLCFFLSLVATPALTAADPTPTGPAASSAAPIRITSVAELRRDSPANLGSPCLLRGHFTFSSPGWPILVFQDASGGLLVQPRADRPAEHGRQVELTGVVGPNATILDADFQYLSDAPDWPAAPLLTAADINTGAHDRRLVSVIATPFSVDTEAGHFRLGLAAGGAQTLTASLPQDGIHAEDLIQRIGVSLRLTGVSGATVDPDGKVIGIRLWLPSLDLLQPASAGTEGTVSLPSPEAILPLKNQPIHDPHPELHAARGQVTWQEDSRTFFIQDSTGGLRVHTREPVTLTAGSNVEVLGQLTGNAPSPSLEAALVRRDANASASWIVPEILPGDRIGEPEHWHRLVSLQGHILQVSNPTNRPVLLVSSEDRVVRAVLRWNPEAPIRDLLRPNAAVRLTGVLVPSRPFPRRESTAWLIVRGPEDLAFTGRVLRLNLRLVLSVLGIGALVTALTVLSALAFRHQVRHRTAELNSSQERLQTVITNAPVILFSTDGQGIFTLSEGKGLANLGLKPGEAVGRSAFHLYRDYPDICDSVRRALRGDSHTARVTVGTATYEVYYGPLRDAAGTITGVIGAATDITERDRADRELAAAHSRLVEISRKAGMAEIATTVLHNVGNTLTSVNVSASLLADQIFNQRNDRLARLATLLRDHEADLSDFLTHHPQGRLVPAYLGQLVEFHALRDREMAEELRALLRNLDHIREIITRQQSYARVGGVLESLPPVDLVQDALEMQAGSLRNHRITVVRRFDDLPALMLDKHKILQILTNLLTNAKQSIAAAGGPAPTLTVIVRRRDPGFFQIRVQDSGLGIPPENLTAIFAHGFTTKRGGHGFGLHSAALYAQEMGGSLTAESDGPGKGATFTLELPAVAPPTALSGPSAPPGDASASSPLA